MYFLATDEQLSPADTDVTYDVYEESGGVITLVSGGTLDEDASVVEVSDDGSRAFFYTAESLDPADADFNGDFYLAAGGAITLVTVGTASGDVNYAAINWRKGAADGSTFLFTTSQQLVPEDTDSRDGCV